MTTIQTFEDILAAMWENPVLRDAMRQHVRDLLDQAIDADILSEGEEYDLVLIDFILLGQTLDGEPAYVVIESSFTINQSDVDRAARRARILQAASGVTRRAAVIGTVISDANRQRADADGVAYIAMAE